MSRPRSHREPSSDRAPRTRKDGRHRRQSILRTCSLCPDISLQELRTALSISKTALDAHLAVLERDGHLEHSSKRGFQEWHHLWHVTEQGRLFATLPILRAKDLPGQLLLKIQ